MSEAEQTPSYEMVQWLLGLYTGGYAGSYVMEIAKHIEHLEAQNAKLVEALKDMVVIVEGLSLPCPTIKARAAIAAAEKGE